VETLAWSAGPFAVAVYGLKSPVSVAALRRISDSCAGVTWLLQRGFLACQV